MPDRRRNGTRVSCNISVKIEILDSPSVPSTPCLIIVVNPQGCGIRLDRPLELGTRVQLQCLPTNRNVIARVMHCSSLGEYERFWFAGLALDEPGNIWGIEKPPEDWLPVANKASQSS